ncbi:MAG: SusC/RagA family TonB-linked outer membrane protein, partial [Rikenellaceae bacterium]|nr:SusC/RagA family TonB-linked outer membrane protein [Rikenellaceae bacterium]
YSLTAPSNGQLSFSFVGMRTQTVQISGRTQIDITMLSDALGIDEVIVVAYGTASKAGYTGSASTVNKDLIARSQVSNVTQLLQGSASGVQVISSSGQPGSESSIYIRGIGSISAETQPLWIVDGAPLDANSSALNPADIESLNVLKDAAATSLYGSRAANGLVIVTTKKGRQNEQARIDASFRYGVSSRAQKAYDRLGTNDYWELYWETLRNDALDNGYSAMEAAEIASRDIVSALEINPYGPNFPQPVGTDGKIVEGAVPLWNDDWIKAYEKGAKRMEAQVGISGGSAKSTYYVSFSYLDQTGIYPGASFERYTGRVNLTNELKPWLRLNTSINLTHSSTNNAGDGDSDSRNALFTAMLIPNFYPVYARDLNTGEYILDADGKKIPDYGDGIYSTRTGNASANSNHIGNAKYDFDRSNRDVALIRTTLEVDLYQGLTYIGSANIDYNMLGSHSYANPVYGSSASGSVTKSFARTIAMTFNNILNYQRSFDEIHSMKLMAGHEYYEYNWTNASASRTGFPSLGLDEPSAASTVSAGSGYSNQYKLLSFFGNAEYNYAQKYFFSASIRTDGSSRFYKDNLWGTFWSVGASWRLSEEDFIREIPEISKFTIRSSYGGQGNDNIGGYYAYMGLYEIYNNLGESGFRTSQLPSYNLKWESQLNFNLGLDLGFWNNRFTLTAEFFNRESKDLLFDVPMAYSTGYSSRSQNIGKMRNRGVEFQISGTPIQTTEWLWTIWANATHFKNKITSIPSPVITTNRLRIKGGSMYDFFLAE